MRKRRAGGEEKRMLQSWEAALTSSEVADRTQKGGGLLLEKCLTASQFHNFLLPTACNKATCQIFSYIMWHSLSLETLRCLWSQDAKVCFILTKFWHMRNEKQREVICVSFSSTFWQFHHLSFTPSVTFCFSSHMFSLTSTNARSYKWLAKKKSVFFLNLPLWWVFPATRRSLCSQIQQRVN